MTLRRGRPWVSAAAAVVLAAVAAVSAGCSPNRAPSATPGGDAVIAAFLEKVQRDDLTFHTVADAVIETRVGDEEETAEFSADLDISGDDAVGEVTVDIGPNITVDVLIRDGEAYAETTPGDWQPIPDFEEQGQAPLNPFERLEGTEDLEYRGRSDNGIHTLRTTVWLGADPESLEAQGWENVEFADHLTDIYVTDDGTPVRMEFEGNATGDYRGEPAEVHFDVDYEFSHVGQPVEIPEP